MDEDIKKDLITYFMHVDRLREDPSDNPEYRRQEILMIENRLRKAVGAPITR